MNKLYSYMYMSVDGVVESPEKWVSPFLSDEMGEDLSRRLQSAAAMVLGGVTYTEFAAFWPRQADDVPFAGINNRIPKLVVSRSITNPQWQNTTVVDEKDVLARRTSGEGDLHITGSGTLVRDWLSRSVIDELRLIVCPVVLGRGRRFFDEGTPVELTLAQVDRLPRGVVALTYEPAKH